VNAPAVKTECDDTAAAAFDIDRIFRAHYERVARVIARVVNDRARAEEIAVEVFLKLWRNTGAQGGNVEGWLYRAAVRMGLDELRRRTRQARYERLIAFVMRVPTPEDVRCAAEQQEKIRRVLAAIGSREAEMLVLRSHGLSYEELASALDVNPASVGKLLSRAQQAFRKEFEKRYGEENGNGG